MAKHVTAQLNATVNTTATVDDSLTIPQENYSQSVPMALADGTGNDAANVQWLSERTLACGATETLALQGSLVAFDGSVINFTKIKALSIENTSQDNTLKVGNAASLAWAALLGATGVAEVPKATAKAHGLLLVFAPAGMTVGASLLNLKLAHGGQVSTTITYRIVIIGEQ